MTPIILVHGGADRLPDEKVPGKIAGVKKSARIGYKILKEGGTSLDAVEAAVRYMEDEEIFNAGHGSALNIDGYIEMDASIMDGSNLNAGAVTVVKDIYHPISLARLVMEKTPHLLLAGEGANRFAKDQGLRNSPPGSLVTKNSQKLLEDVKKRGFDRTNIQDVDTVGAVAIDSSGNLAAATSTGGTSGKMVGRSSDACMIGSGTYADNHIAAVSTTGHGESIAKYCVAHSIVKDMEYGKSAQNATRDILNKLTQKLNNTAGAITISSRGDLGIYFTSKRMSWAYKKGDELHYGIEQGQDDIEKIKESTQI